MQLARFLRFRGIFLLTDLIYVILGFCIVTLSKKRSETSPITEIGRGPEI